jgi:ABC-type Fe3+/spermidine/putrescine transport system ATPase subunit
MAYLEITGLPLRPTEGDFGPTVNLALERGRGLSVLSADGNPASLIADALTGYGDFSGEIILNERRIDPLPARNRPLKVLGDRPGILPRLTVRENLEAAAGEREIDDAGEILSVERELTESPLAGLGDLRAGLLDDACRTILAGARALLMGCDLLLIEALPVPGAGKFNGRGWHPGAQMDALLDLKSLLRRHRATWVSFVNDPAAVHILSDKVAIFSKDSLIQEGSLRECLNAPRTRLVADFLAFPRMNYKRVRIERDGPFVMLRTGRYGFSVSEYAKRHVVAREGEEAILGIKPEDVRIRAYETGDPTVMNLAKVVRVDSVPGSQVVRVDLEGEEWVSLVEAGRPIFTGQLVEIRPDPDRLHLFHADHGASLLD